jgi:catechol 2,3-dioxygenase-like lactoylglutathione lyase family enzyme
MKGNIHMARPLLSHIDLRVRDRVRSKAFYDALLGDLGFIRRDSEQWTSYFDGANAAPGPSDFEWFGFTEDASPVPNSNRIAFVATSNDEVDRVADVLRRIGARNLEGPNYDEGPGYYAVFFEDPDGHRLEVCCRTR